MLDGDNLIGLTITFPDDNDIKFYQDHRYWRCVPGNIDFKIDSVVDNDYCWLVADGYGNLINHNLYGNGKIAVNKEIIVELLKQKKRNV